MSTDQVPQQGEPNGPVRVVLVDDQPLLREGIATILEAQPALTVVGQASSGEEALEVVARTQPHVVCMDVEMPGMNGLEATRRIVAENPEGPKVLVLTTFNRDDYLLAALRAGASAFLLKTAKPEQLADAIRSVAAGDALLSPEVTRSIIERAVASGDLSGSGPLGRGGTEPSGDSDTGSAASAVASADAGPVTGPSSARPTHAVGHAASPASEGAPTTQQAPTAALTEREREVLALVARGMSNDEIAAELVVGRATVKTHVSNVLMKLHLRDRVQAVAYAYQHGLAGTP